MPELRQLATWFLTLGQESAPESSTPPAQESHEEHSLDKEEDGNSGESGMVERENNGDEHALMMMAGNRGGSGDPPPWRKRDRTSRSSEHSRLREVAQKPRRSLGPKPRPRRRKPQGTEGRWNTREKGAHRPAW